MNPVTARVSSTRAAVYSLITACVAVGACAAAHASDATVTTPAHPGGASSVTVRYADLNLSTPEGASALYARISHAAHQVCDASDIRDLEGLAADRSCERAAIAHAVNEVHSTQLASVVRVRIPQS